MKIWIDDIRTPPDKSWLWFKTSKEALSLLDSLYNSPYRELIPFGTWSLDHDLGDDDTTRPIVLWFCEHDFWPVEVRVHSANPVGVEWLEGMIKRYKP
jgi:hypothetical protein